jgi:acetyltransferase-like isoleucine patch superfamily enzyme
VFPGLLEVAGQVSTERERELLAELRTLLGELRGEMRERWHRDLPLEELLGDRWERAGSLGFGEGSSIYASSYVYGDVRVGRKTWIGPHTLLDGSGGLVIGDGCDISAGAQIYTHDTVRRVLSDGRSEIEHGPVAIGDQVHVGAGAIILKGIAIGDHSVIAAGSVVNRSIPANAVAAGVPCRPIGTVEIAADGTVSLRYPRR